MSKFTQLSDWYEPSFEREKFITIKPLRWEIGKVGSGLWLNVPVGEMFDVTVPVALRWLINRFNPRYFKAAALHDFALSSGWDRVSSAAAFSEALRADGVGVVKRLVLVLGTIAWNWN